MVLDLNEDEIIWPGGLKKKPTGLMIPTHLKVKIVRSLILKWANFEQNLQPSRATFNEFKRL